jgi:hypothetical protein
LDTGEIAWATDTKKLYVGDGSTQGGVNILATSVDTTSGLAWDNTTQKIKYTGALGSAISNVVEDTSPELGGNLNLNNNTINGTGTINFTGNITASALSLTTGLTSNLPLNGRNITGTGNIDITGNLSATGTLIATTGLGANLPLNSRNITGTGNINITGNITASGLVTASSGVITSTITPNLEGDTLLIKTTNQIPLSVRSITSGAPGGGVPYIEMTVSKGTLSAPVNNSAGDLLGGFQIAGYYNGNLTAASLVSRIDPSANMSNSSPGSIFAINVNNNVGDSTRFLFYGISGIFNAPVVQTSVYSVATTALPSAVTMGVGARAFVTDSVSNVFGDSYTGGGSYKVPVYSNGTLWYVG